MRKWQLIYITVKLTCIKSHTLRAIIAYGQLSMKMVTAVLTQFIKGKKTSGLLTDQLNLQPIYKKRSNYMHVYTILWNMYCS